MYSVLRTVSVSYSKLPTVTIQIQIQSDSGLAPALASLKLPTPRTDRWVDLRYLGCHASASASASISASSRLRHLICTPKSKSGTDVRRTEGEVQYSTNLVPDLLDSTQLDSNPTFNIETRNSILHDNGMRSLPYYSHPWIRPD